MSSLPEVGSFIYQFERTMFVYAYGLACCPGHFGPIYDIREGWRLATKDEVYAWYKQEREIKRTHLQYIARLTDGHPRAAS